MYILRFVNKNASDAISSWGYSLRFKLRAADIAFLSYLRCEMFNMLDRLSLMNVSEHFAFYSRMGYVLLVRG